MKLREEELEDMGFDVPERKQILENQKLRELIEKWKDELKLILSIYPKDKLSDVGRAATEDVHNKIQKLLKESKK